MDLYSNKKDIIYFLGIFSVIFLISFFIFSLTGLAPEGYRISDFLGKEQVIENYSDAIDYNSVFYQRDDRDQLVAQNYTRPDRIIISKIGVDTSVLNPNTRDVVELDRYLLQGAVHYPGSGSIEKGNMFVFGHSSGLQNVRNQAYKAFNNLNKLSIGDTIEVFAAGKKYNYRVKSVKLVNENSALVRFDNSKRMITISTCNTFGSKQERWVIEAEFLR
ncbi:MAG TPA: sortase [Candidatus Paceibacterota bacterium]|nr:sortase [Candidatus Paceibacterota bacterium]HMP18810.1 sortase [Candidatus Paceibacterota bacterium]HMP85305.1 sortase [Candidatus Paceibacterota bacterium]